MRTRGDLAIFTICSNNYMPAAKILLDSARRFHPKADFFLGLADEMVADDGFYPGGCTVIPARDLQIPEFECLAFRYDIMEFNTAIKPYMFLHLFKAGYERVVYFDPDIEVFAPLDSITDALARGASFVLTPHLCSPAEDGSPRNDIDIMRTGVFNLGFLAASRHPETEPILRWWARRLRYQCLNDQDGGIFVDQKFMDLVPGFTDHTCILRDTTLNVAYWNLGQRRLEQAGDGFLVDGRPLTFFHYSGFDSGDLTRLSKHTLGFRDDIPEALQALLERYADQLAAKGKGSAPPPPYGFANFASGTPIPDVVRRMFRDRHLSWSGNPFETYEEYLHLPALNASRDSSSFIVTNLMRYMHDVFGDVRSQFDLYDARAVERFVRWYVDHGPGRGLDRRLIEPVAERAEGRGSGRARFASAEPSGPGVGESGSAPDGAVEGG